MLMFFVSPTTGTLLSDNFAQISTQVNREGLQSEEYRKKKKKTLGCLPFPNSDEQITNPIDLTRWDRGLRGKGIQGKKGFGRHRQTNILPETLRSNHATVTGQKSIRSLPREGSSSICSTSRLNYMRPCERTKSTKEGNWESGNLDTHRKKKRKNGVEMGEMERMKGKSLGKSSTGKTKRNNQNEGDGIEESRE